MTAPATCLLLACSAPAPGALWSGEPHPGYEVLLQVVEQPGG